MAIHPFDVAIPVSRHFQDNLYYCGAACAQMAIETQQAQFVDQAELYEAVESPPGWMTSPTDLASTLNNYVRGATYAVVSHGNSRRDVMRRMAWSMCRHRRPAMALVHGGDHWVVVESLVGTTNDDALQPYQPEITDVVIRDPSPDLVNQRESLYVTTPTPPPHSSQDLCASAFYEQESYTWYGWEQVFTRCATRGEWDDCWVGVCVPQDEPCVTTQSDPGQVDVQEPNQPEPSRPASSGSQSAANLMRVATELLRTSGLRRRPEWMHAVDASTRCSARIVHHLDRGDAYYLLVLLDTDGRGRLLARLDASTLRLLHAALEPSGALVERLNTLPDATEGVVWTPCAESRSPFFPLVKTEGRRRSGYRLLDGRTFDRLSLRRSWRRDGF